MSQSIQPDEFRRQPLQLLFIRSKQPTNGTQIDGDEDEDWDSGSEGASKLAGDENGEGEAEGEAKGDVDGKAGGEYSRKKRRIGGCE